MSAGATGKLVVLSGPSGVGKSTVAARVVAALDATLSISATTRPMGRGEVDGKNYHFLSREGFERQLDAGEFLEHAEYLGNLYGTPAGPVREALQAGRDVVLEIEVQGGIQVARAQPDAVMIYLLPADRRVLVGRIQGRGRDEQDVIDERLENAEREIQLAKDAGVYEHFVVNDVLDDTVAWIVEIVEARRQGRAATG